MSKTGDLAIDALDRMADEGSLLWGLEDPIASYLEEGFDVPQWIDKDISPNDVAAIVQGGCASGAYMPAVTDYKASWTMSQYGDCDGGVLEFIENQTREIPQPPKDQSWAGLACFYLSYAVELWAGAAQREFTEKWVEQKDIAGNTDYSVSVDLAINAIKMAREP